MIEDNNRLFILVILIALVVYGPFIFKGGFGPSDDVTYVEQALGKSNALQLSINRMINDINQTRSGGIAARPVSIIALTIANVFFQNNPTPYIIIQLTLWFLCIVLISYTLKHTIGKRAALIFLLLGPFPIFASTTVFSSYYFAEYGLPVFFWALSLIFQYRYISNRKLYNYILVYILLMLGLLSLSIILPLLLVSAFLPIIYENELNGGSIKEDIFKLGVRYILPVALVAFVFFAFKVYGTRLYNIDTIPKGLEAGIGIKSLVKSGYYFYVVLLEVPIMLIELFPHLANWYVLTCGILLLSYFGIIMSDRGVISLKADRVNKKTEKQFIVLVLCSLACGTVVFFISGYPCVTFGYYNRMLVPSFLLLSIIVSYLIRQSLKSRWIYLSIVVSFLWVSSMIVQIDNFIESWEIRDKIYRDWTGKLNNVDLGPKPYILACVPFFTENNYNNEEVFFAHFYKDGLNLYGSPEIDGQVISWRSIARSDNYMTFLNFPEGFTKPSNLWYYEWDIKTKQSKFERIISQEQLEKKILQININKINYHPIIMRERMLMKFRNYAMKNI